MSLDPPTRTSVDETGPDLTQIDEEERRSDRRSLWRLLPVLIAIVVVIIVLLLLRDCGGANRVSGGTGTKSIEDVKGLEPLPGAVSLWVTSDAKVAEVLAAAGVDAAESIDLGGGRYVLDVAPGSEAAAIAALKKTPGVNDAGRVFQAE